MDFLPFLGDGVGLFYGGEGLGEFAAADEEFAVELASWPVFGKKLREVELVSVPRKHLLAGPQTPDAV